MISYSLGSGVLQHIETLIAALEGRANVFVVNPGPAGVQLSAPALHDRRMLSLPAERMDDLISLLRLAAVSRVHLHHLAGMTLDVRTLIHCLDVAYDVTVHDYFADPGLAVCNACIAARPSYVTTDITSWRREQSWPFFGADRVICPSQDVYDRLARFGLAARAVVWPHELIQPGI